MFPDSKRKGGKIMEPEIVGKRIRQLMEKNELEVEQLADRMQLSVTDLKNKLDGKEEFYIDEMMKIKTIFELSSSDCDQLFFQEEIKQKKFRKTNFVKTILQKD